MHCGRGAGNGADDRPPEYGQLQSQRRCGGARSVLACDEGHQALDRRVDEYRPSLVPVMPDDTLSAAADQGARTPMSADAGRCTPHPKGVGSQTAGLTIRRGAPGLGDGPESGTAGPDQPPGSGGAAY
jgi:hypothetical protein